MNAQDVMQRMRNHYENTALSNTGLSFPDVGSGAFHDPTRNSPLYWSAPQSPGSKFFNERTIAQGPTGTCTFVRLCLCDTRFAFVLCSFCVRFACFVCVGRSFPFASFVSASLFTPSLPSPTLRLVYRVRIARQCSTANGRAVMVRKNISTFALLCSCFLNILAYFAM
jgi:hypothetical protein